MSLPNSRESRTLYFAFGSNLNLEQVVARCPAIRPVASAVLPDWALTFRRVADVVPDAGSTVYGALYSLSPACEAALDRYEGFRERDPFNGMYRKEFVRVRDGSGKFRRAMLYRMNRGPIAPPPQGYYETIRDGYEAWRLPTIELDRAARHALDVARGVAVSRPKAPVKPRAEIGTDRQMALARGWLVG